MRILDIRPATRDADLQAARQILAAEVADPNTVLLIIRGDSPDIGAFAERASRVTDGTGFRETVWVRNTDIFLQGQEERWFGDDAAVCAVVLDFGDQPVDPLTSDASLFEIDEALRHAITPEEGR